MKKDINKEAVKGSQKTEVLLMNYEISVPKQLELFWTYDTFNSYQIISNLTRRAACSAKRSTTKT